MQTIAGVLRVGLTRKFMQLTMVIGGIHNEKLAT
jgi:hypothetical protein